MISLQTSHPTSISRWLAAAALAILFLFLAGCDQPGTMIEQPRYDPMESSELFPDGVSARAPVAGSVPYTGETSPNSPELTGLAEDGTPFQGFPVAVDADLLQRGEERYAIFCVPCHGPAGEGNGRVTQFGYEKPPSLLAENAKGLSNGEMFEIIKNGRGKMFPYGSRVAAADRWAVIAYMRAMQTQNGAVNAQELTPEQIEQIGSQK